MERKLILVFAFFIVLAIAVFGYLNFFFFPSFGLPAEQQQSAAPQKPKPPTFPVDVFNPNEGVTPPFDFYQIQQPKFADKICNILNYGAVSDYVTMNTKAFADAINDCTTNGGGTVEVPKGVWVTGAIELKDNINLHLDDGSKIIFSDNPNDYLPAVQSRYEGIDYIGYSPFIYAKDATNIAVTGKGILEGQGSKWWPKNNMNATYTLYNMAEQNVPLEKRVFDNQNMMLRPSFIEFVNSNSILLQDFEIKNSPMWTIHPLYSSNIIINHVDVDTGGLNTDGIAIDSCQNVLMENSTVLSGDDAIVIKSGRDDDGLRVNKPSENIVIRNMNVTGGHSGIAFGSETSGGIKNVFAYNCSFSDTTFGLRIKSSVGRGGTVENIWANNINTRAIDNTAIQLTTNYDAPYAPDNTAIPTFRNININSFITSKASTAITAVGIESKPLEQISLSDIRIKSKIGATFTNVKNLSLDNMQIQNRQNSPFVFSNANFVSISNSKCLPVAGKCMQIAGDQSSDFQLSSSNITLSKILFENKDLQNIVSFQ